MPIQKGDSLPAVTLYEGAPDKQVNLLDELSTGKGVVIGVPAAFSPGCSSRHIPEYMSNKNLHSAGKVFIVSVNDAFVMKAWQENLDPDGKSGIRFLADPRGDFSKAVGASFEHPAAFGDARSKRMAIKTEDGKAVSVHIEPDNIGINESAAANVLGE